MTFLNTSSSQWLVLIVKSLAFCTGYLVLLFALEGKALYQSFMQFAGLQELVKQVRVLLGREK